LKQARTETEAPVVDCCGCLAIESDFVSVLIVVGVVGARTRKTGTSAKKTRRSKRRKIFETDLD